MITDFSKAHVSHENGFPRCVGGWGFQPVFKDYLERHGLLKYVQALLHAVIQVGKWFKSAQLN